MAKREQFLVIDIGSTAIHMGEFESTASDALVLHAFDSIEYPEALTDDNRKEVVAGVIGQALASGKYTSKTVSLCVSGQSAFMRFVKLPPVTDDETSVRKIVEFEAKQNVPFPIDEVVWDYQLIGREDDEDELEVMFAVIKNEIVESVISTVKSCGLKPKLVDFSPAALYNAARLNYVGEDECAMLLDIGGKCTTLLFMEGGRFFARSIPIAGASISQQIAKEFNISVDEAEVLKRRYGFVALGGAYEEPESEVAATISKIIRNVMTRLHGEINRTINIYRSQQKGSKPVKLYLAGGSSTMAFTEHFFSEKLRMEVTYFNAFNIIQFGPNIDRDGLSQQAHLFPGLVGVALRSCYHCPVEIGLMTNDIKKGSDMKKRLPMIVASCAIFLFCLVVSWGMNFFQIQQLDRCIAEEQSAIKQEKQWKSGITKALASAARAEKSYKKVKDVLATRDPWNELINALQDSKPLDVWVTSIEPTSAPAGSASAEPVEKPTSGMATLFGPRKKSRAGASDEAEKKEAKAAWFLVRGYSVKIPEARRVNDEQAELVRSIFHEEQVLKFEQIFKRRVAENPDIKNELEQLKGKLPLFDNRVSTQTILPTVFLNALRFSEFFDAAATKLEQFGSGHPNAENVIPFTIRVKLEVPISLKR